MASKISSVTREANRWTAKEDLIIYLLVSSHTFAEIGLRLGRTGSAVQRRASRKGYLRRVEEREATETRASLSRARRDEILRTDEVFLAAYVPECDEEPVLPHAGSRTYHREYKRKQRSED